MAAIDTPTGTVIWDRQGRIGIIRRNPHEYMHLWLTPEEQDALWEVLKNDDRRATYTRIESRESEEVHTNPSVG